jgi:hypothetical protein
MLLAKAQHPLLLLTLKAGYVNAQDATDAPLAGTAITSRQSAH